MKTTTSAKFKTNAELIANLTKKATRYPLLAQLYLPVIKQHSEKNKNFTNFEDWLLIPYFEYLYRRDKKRLISIENDLQAIYKNMGQKEFELLCNDLLHHTNHEVINSIHNKLFSFYAELRGILYHINDETRVHKIQRSDKKMRPDYRAISSDKAIIFECKFKQRSNTVKTFIKRYIRFLSLFCPKYRKNNRLLALDICYKTSGLFPEELTTDQINLLKEFIYIIVQKKAPINPIILHYTRRESENNNQKKEHRCEVSYDNSMPLGLVTIGEQVQYFQEKLAYLENKKVLKNLIDKAHKQLSEHAKDNEQQRVFICFQMDDEYKLPWEEIEELKKEYFASKVGVIIEDVSGLV